jgi:hypothetical protein
MWKITRTITAYYPFIILELTSLSDGESGLWSMADGQSEDILREYHARNLEGIVLDKLPKNGGWMDEDDIHKL